MGNDEQSYLVYQDDVKNLQLRVTISEFKDVEYLHIRKYFLSYEGEWVPSLEGVSMPISIDNIVKLTDALLDICSTAEGTDLLKKHFIDRFQKSSLEFTQ